MERETQRKKQEAAKVSATVATTTVVSNRSNGIFTGGDHDIEKNKTMTAVMMNKGLDDFLPPTSAETHPQTTQETGQEESIEAQMDVPRPSIEVCHL